MSGDLVPYVPQARARRRLILLFGFMLLGGLVSRIVLGPDIVFILLSTVLPPLVVTPIFNWWDYRQGAEMVTPEERVERRRQEKVPFWFAVVPQSFFYGAFMGLFASTHHTGVDARDVEVLLSIAAGSALAMGLFRALFEAARRLHADRRPVPVGEERLSRFESIAHILILFCMTLGVAIAAASVFADRFEAGAAYVGGTIVGLLAAAFMSPEPRISLGAGEPTFGVIFGRLLLAMSFLGLIVAGAIFTFEPTNPPIHYLELAGSLLAMAVGLSLFLWAIAGAAAWTPGLRQRQ